MIIADDTIVAIASPLSPARRGIVRMSGDRVVSILELTGVRPTDDSTRRATRFPATLDLGPPLGRINVDVMLWPTRRSYTGQPSAEFHLIGSLPILDAVVSTLVAAGARPARPGEFTMRAFLAGRLDLTQAEAVLGVIDADDPQTLDRALSQLAGNLSRPLQHARDTLLNLLADVEAGLDFVDEDIEFIEDVDLIQRLEELSAVLSRALMQLRDRGEHQSSINVVLRGLPNAGKSCLLNQLSQTDTAIVTDQAGTTRDVITVRVDDCGHHFLITDTAGIEHRGSDEVDYEVTTQAQCQASRAIDRADVGLWCLDASGPIPTGVIEQINDSRARRQRTSVDLVLLTKMDLIASTPRWKADLDSMPLVTIPVSVKTGIGLATLWQQLTAIADRHDVHETGGVIGTAARCRDSLAHAIRCIEIAIQSTRDQLGHELVAAEMRTAVEQLGEVTGAVYTDDILDRVFSRFCIGK